MEKQNLDWANIGFGYRKTHASYVSYYKDGKWDDGAMTADNTVTLSEAACVFHYAQCCFEGIKAYTTEDGRIVMFRPDQNAKRMKDTCERLMMPVFPEERFLEAITRTVRENADFVPPYGSGASLYIRPFMIGSGPVLGVSPAEEYLFRVLVTPVGPYYKGGMKPIRVVVSDYDRAAPHGTGNVKAGLNYAMSMYPGQLAHAEGYSECLYLDPATRTKIEEAGGANFIAVTKSGKLITPKSDSILPSITRRSVLQIAKDVLGIEVEETDLYIDQLDEIAEAGLCGTAAVISPIGSVDYHGKRHVFYSETEVGPVIKKLYETLVGIQNGKLPAPEGWIYQVL
ncbi:MAG TPA: branched-chain amino acid aminotransferase [Candidatus Fimivivens faecavium]|nr:branched-chain amino acid aminotransferase [Candidatus Fimivivens faecavium]